MLKTNWLKPKLAEGGPVIGTFAEIPSPYIVELLGLAGFDFVVIDCEHGSITTAQAEEMIRAAASTGISPLVRVAKAEETAIRLPLDMGAVGIHVPQVESVAQAELSARAARFHPDGERGMQPFVRGASFRSYPNADYRALANTNTMVIPHIEGRGGLDHLEAILAVPGIDVCFLGPYDLSQALGIPAQVTDPRIDEAIERAVALAGTRSVIGTYADDAAAARKRLSQGVRYLTVGLDAAFLMSGARETLQRLRGA
jgi:4-hydroxy-2-oxoheptanedioate aldolase